MELGNGSLPINITGVAVDAGGGGGLRMASAEMTVDAWGGGATQAGAWGGPMPLPPQGIPASNLELRVMVDLSLVEVGGEDEGFGDLFLATY